MSYTTLQASPHALIVGQGVLSAFTLYIMTMILFKIALAIFYFRIVVRTWHKWTVYIALTVNTTYGLFYVSPLGVRQENISLLSAVLHSPLSVRQPVAILRKSASRTVPLQ